MKREPIYTSPEFRKNGLIERAKKFVYYMNYKYMKGNIFQKIYAAWKMSEGTMVNHQIGWYYPDEEGGGIKEYFKNGN